MRRSSLYLLFLGLISLGLFACTESEDPTDPNDSGTNTPPNAVISASTEIGTGTVVSLDGTGSSDPDGDNLTFAWTLMEKPSASTATLSGASTASAEFTPDEVGSYKVSLTVSDGSADDTAEHSMITEIEVLGNITEDRTLVDIVDDPSMPDYRIESDIDISAVLTIDPGVVIHADEGNIVEVQSAGVLIATGTETDSVVITSSNETGDIHWGGLIINSGDSRNELTYTRISYAGANERLYYRTALGDVYANIGIREDARLSVNNSLISNSGSFGLHIDYDGELNSFGDNKFTANTDAAMQMPINQFGAIDSNTLMTNNGRNSVQAYGTSIALGDDQTWSELADDATYHIVADVNIHAELTINEGVKIELDEGVRFEVHSDGVLMSNGVETNPVIFTSADITGGRYWTGLTIRSSDSRNALNYTEVSYGGTDVERQYYRTALGDVHSTIAVTEDARLSMVNSTVSHSANKGIALDYDAEFVNFQDNEFNNNQDDPILIHVNALHGVDGGTVFTDNADDIVRVYNDNVLDAQTWSKLSGTAAYRFMHQVDIENDLIIEAGTRLEFEEDVEVTIHSNGSLVAEGASGNEIIFTSANEAGQIRWAGIDVISTSALNSLDYVTVNWAGGNQRLFYSTSVDADGNVHANIGLQDDARLKLTNSRILNAGEYGVALLSGAEINGSRDANTIINANTEFNNPDATADVLVE